MKTPPTPPAAESAHTPLPVNFITIESSDGGRAGTVSTADASMILWDEANNEIFRAPIPVIVGAVNAHAAAQQRIGELEKALDGIVDLYVSGYLKPEAGGPARFYHAFKQARLALRHPERT